jgi:hypothetical protein
VALAVSLNTPRRGPSGKGRFFLPMPAVTINPGNLEISAADAQGVADSAAQWLNDLGNEPGVDVLGLAAVVASTKGYNTRVSSVRVGRVLDTIRTRRRSLKEAYGANVGVDATT